MNYKNSSCAIIMGILGFFLFPFTATASQKGFYLSGHLGVASGPNTISVHPGYFPSSTGGTVSGARKFDVYGLQNRGKFAGSVAVGYNFLPYVGLEMNYTRLGWHNQNLLTFNGANATAAKPFTGELRAYAVSLNAVGYLPIGIQDTDFVGKLGLGVLHNDFEVVDYNGGAIFVNKGTYHLRSNKSIITLAFGVQHYFMPHLAGNVEYNKFIRINSQEMGNVGFDMISIGAVYSFG